MLLYLVRHGIAIDREDPNCPSEEERYLTPEGIKKTRTVAKALKPTGASADRMLTSPLVRAVQTAEVFAEVLGFDKAAIERTDTLAPGGLPKGFFAELAARQAESVMAFGHAPDMDDLLAYAIGSKREVTELKKAGVACLEVDPAAPTSGLLLWLATPKLLRAGGK